MVKSPGTFHLVKLSSSKYRSFQSSSHCYLHFISWRFFLAFGNYVTSQSRPRPFMLPFDWFSRSANWPHRRWKVLSSYKVALGWRIPSMFRMQMWATFTLCPDLCWMFLFWDHVSTLHLLNPHPSASHGVATWDPYLGNEWMNEWSDFNSIFIPLPAVSSTLLPSLKFRHLPKCFQILSCIQRVLRHLLIIHYLTLLLYYCRHYLLTAFSELWEIPDTELCIRSYCC